MTRIVAIGECMVELSPQPDTEYVRIGFAGDTLNTAWYLRRLLPPSAKVDYLTAVGTDDISDRMVAFLDAAGIGTGQILLRPALTVGLYMIQLTDGERSFAYWRGQSAARTLAQDAQALRDALAGADIAYFSGITLAILPEQDRATLLEVLRQFRAGGGTVAFDPNLRPRLWPTVKDMTRSVMDAAAVSDIALPSFEDEASYFGDLSPEDTAHRYAAVGVTEVVVKNGADPMLVLAAGTRTIAAAPTVDTVVDTTAAGDSFNAGYLAARVQGSPISTALTAGAGLAARVITRTGALVDF